MKKTISVLTVFVLLFVLTPTLAFAQAKISSATTVNLIAGKHTDAGDITVWNDADNLYVRYQTDKPFCLLETHLQVATSLDGIPQANGNPVPGKFEYKKSYNCAKDLGAFHLS